MPNSVDYLISGHHPLRGSISVKGSPLATVGVLAAAILSPDKVTITNVPHLQDIDTLLQELRLFGVTADWTDDHEITVHAQAVTQPSQDLSAKVVYGWPPSLLVAVIIRCRQLQLESVSPAFHHSLIFAWELLQQFGAEISYQSSTLQIKVSHLHAAGVELLTATAEQTLTAIILAAAADGQSLLDGTIINPEIDDVIQALRAMTVDIERIDESRLRIQGQPEIQGTTYRIITDRFEAAFLAVAAIATSGDIQINDTKPALIMPFLAKLHQMGIDYNVEGSTLRIWHDKHHPALKSISLTAKPFPGLGQDWLLLFIPVAMLAAAPSTLSAEPADELHHALTIYQAFAGQGQVESHGVIIQPVQQPQSATVILNTFTRSLIALLLSLASPGQSHLQRIESLDGRFENLDQRLAKLGAKIQRQEVAIPQVNSQ